MMNDRIAIVTPWFGPECRGGAESLATELARRFAEHFDVDVLTTCSQAFLSDWGVNFHDAGESSGDGYRIRRFPVDPRATTAFDSLNAALLAMDPRKLRAQTATVPLSSQLTFLTENINSSQLIRYINVHRESYLRFLFLPYLYGTTLRGLSAAGSRGILQPCLHNESYAYLRPVEISIHRAPMLLFNSDGEYELARQIYGPGIEHKSVIVGSGVEILDAPQSKTPLPQGLAPERYALYLGRRDTTKGVDALLSAFRESNVDDFKLVLAGPGDHSYGDNDNVVDLGFVDDDLRAALLQHASFLVQPSLNESYSRVIMETWAYARPVIAHSRCLATATAVARSGGGILADSPSDWSEAIQDLARSPKKRLEEMGRSGRSYAGHHADWGAVIKRYIQAFRASPNDSEDQPVRPSIHQVVETLEFGDAISNHAIAIRDHLRNRGYQSDILVRHVGSLVIDEARTFLMEIVLNSQSLIYHHSIGSELTQQVVDSGIPTLMIYHNITPASYFRRLRPELAATLELGRLALHDLHGTFKAVAADSEYNASELLELGYSDVAVLPIIADFRRFDVNPNPDVLRTLADGHHNILFVGRYAPNKALHDLIRVFAVLRCAGVHSRLVLAGRFDGNESYYNELRSLALELGVLEAIIFTGLISDSELLAYYLSADVFLSLSDHEGFGVPLVEAMAFDIPVVAFDSSAVGETLGDAGLLLRDKSDAAAVAALVRIVLEDPELQSKLRASQRRRLASFDKFRTLQLLDKLIAKLHAGAESE